MLLKLKCSWTISLLYFTICCTELLSQSFALHPLYHEHLCAWHSVCVHYVHHNRIVSIIYYKVINCLCWGVFLKNVRKGEQFSYEICFCEFLYFFWTFVVLNGPPTIPGVNVKVPFRGEKYGKQKLFRDVL